MERYSNISKSVTKANKLLALVFFVSDKCNMKCNYCYNKFPRSNIDANLETFFDFAKTIFSQKIIEDLVILGGEPTLHSGLERFVTRLCDFHSRIENIILWSNFTQPLEYYVKLLDLGIKIAISWHSLPNDLNNLEFIKKALALPKKYLENDQIIELDLMAEQDNFNGFEFAYNLLYPKYKKLIYVWPVYTSNLVIGKYSNSQVLKFIKISKELGRFIFQIKKNNNNDFSIETPLYNYNGWRCNAGLDYIYVHCDGNVYNCQSYYQFNQPPIFNLKDLDKIDLTKVLKPCKCNVQSCRFADYQVHREKE